MFHTDRLTIDDITPEILAELAELYPHAYHDSRMYPEMSADIEDFRRRPGSREAEVYRLTLARDDAGRLLGARVIQLRDLPASDHCGHPPLYGKRFCVRPQARNRGVGRALVAEGKRYAFDEAGFALMFGASGEVGGLSMYGREGAMYSLASIDVYNDRNSPEQNRFHIARFLTDPALRGLRLNGDVHFAYARDDAARELLRANGYIAKDELLAYAAAAA